MSDVFEQDPVDVVEVDDGELAVAPVPPDCDADADDGDGYDEAEDCQ